MQKKKDNSTAVIVWGIILIITLFLSLNLGFAINDKEQMELAAGIEEENVVDSLNIIVEYFEKELQTFSLESFVWNDTVKKTVMAGGFIWFMVVAYYYSEQKNLITGKEYGTSRWGALADIRDLFAEVIMNKEIAKAKKMRTPLGQMSAERETIRECRMYAEDKKKQELEQLEQWYRNELELITHTNGKQ